MQCVLFIKNPDLVRDTSLKLEDITNNAWRVYFSIANDIINVEQKNTLDEITINMYHIETFKIKVRNTMNMVDMGRLKVHLHTSKRLISILM